MKLNDFYERMVSGRFTPARFVLIDGRTFDVWLPEMLLVTDIRIHFCVYAEGAVPGRDLAERTELVPTSLIERIEPLPVTAADGEAA